MPRVFCSLEEKARVFRTLKEKKDIVREAYHLPNCVKATARKYDITPELIRRWKKKITADEAAQSPAAAATLTRLDLSRILARKTCHKGSKGTLSDEERAHLLTYIDNLRQQGRVVTMRMVTIELIRFAPAHADVDFKKLIHRIRRFCIRNKIVQRRVTHAAQNHDYNVDLMREWVVYVNEEIVLSQYLADCIVNIDQTNIDVDISPSTFLESLGSRTVSVKTTGSSERCMVILGVTLSGQKLPALLIFKGQPGPRSRIIKEFSDPAYEYPQDMFYTVQPKAWDDAVTHVLWIEQVWLPFCRQRNAPTYLILDEFKVHMQTKIVRATQQLGTQIEFIPGGHTGALQILDKGVNKPFKDHYQRQQLGWQIVNDENAKPKRQDVAQWVRKAWEDVSVESITNTWRSIGINAWDGA